MKFWYEVNFKYLGKVIIIIINILKFVGKAWIKRGKSWYYLTVKN